MTFTLYKQTRRQHRLLASIGAIAVGALVVGLVFRHKQRQRAALPLPQAPIGVPPITSDVPVAIP